MAVYDDMQLLCQWLHRSLSPFCVYQGQMCIVLVAIHVIINVTLEVK